MNNIELDVKLLGGHLHISSSDPLVNRWFIIEGLSMFELYEIPRYGGKEQLHSQHSRLGDALEDVGKLT